MSRALYLAQFKERQKQAGIVPKGHLQNETTEVNETKEKKEKKDTSEGSSTTVAMNLIMIPQYTVEELYKWIKQELHTAVSQRLPGWELMAIETYRRCLFFASSVASSGKEELALQQAAFYYGMATLSRCIMQTAEELKVDNLIVPMSNGNSNKQLRLRLEFYCDHSGSMQTSKLISYMESLTLCLRSLNHRGALIDIYMFGDDTNQGSAHTKKGRKPYSVNEYIELNDQYLRTTGYRKWFDGSKTEFSPAWNMAHTYQTNEKLKANVEEAVICIITSDGEYNGCDSSILRLSNRPDVRAIVYYAPQWSPPHITTKYAEGMRPFIPSDAIYNGEILPGQITRLEEVIGSIIGGSPNKNNETPFILQPIPDIPGRCRLGLWSVPKLMLMPVYMMRLLRHVCEISSSSSFLSSSTSTSTSSFSSSTETITKVANAALLLQRITAMFNHLYNRAQLDLEGCMESEIFVQLMSLIPCVNRLTEAYLQGKPNVGDPSSISVPSTLSSSSLPSLPIRELDVHWFGLLKAVQNVRKFMSGPNGVHNVVQKYMLRKDFVRAAHFEDLNSKATTVSERVEIFERKGKPNGVIQFPLSLCTDLDQLTAMMVRLRSLFRKPINTEGEVELDALFISLWKGARLVSLSTEQDKISDDDIFELMDAFQWSIPYWTLSSQKNKTIVDINTAIRCFPSLLRIVGKERKLKIVEESTFQPKTAHRIGYFLQVAAYQDGEFNNSFVKSDGIEPLERLAEFKSLLIDDENKHLVEDSYNIIDVEPGMPSSSSSFVVESKVQTSSSLQKVPQIASIVKVVWPEWLTLSLQKLPWDAGLADESEPENLTPWWIHILLQKMKVNDSNNTRGDVYVKWQRQLLIYEARILLQMIMSQSYRIEYKSPVYGEGVSAFIDMQNPLLFVLSGGETSHEITDPLEIERAYEINFAMRGAYIRLPYLNGGRIFLAGKPSPRAQMEEQIKQVMNTSAGLLLHKQEQCIKAHLNTLFTYGGPFEVKEDKSIVTWSHPEVQRAYLQCKNAPILTEMKYYQVPSVCVAHAICTCLQNQKLKETKEKKEEGDFSTILLTLLEWEHSGWTDEERKKRALGEREYVLEECIKLTSIDECIHRASILPLPALKALPSTLQPSDITSIYNEAITLAEARLSKLFSHPKLDT